MSELPDLPPPDVSPYDSDDINGPVEYAWYEPAVREYARQAVAAEREWRPIETAPFEDVEHGPDLTAKWLTWSLLGRHDEHGWVEWVGCMDAGLWLVRDDARACGDSAEPTHWMPLPEPPQ